MFTGLVQDIGEIRLMERQGDLRVVIGCGFDMARVPMGASIVCSGCCLTVVEKGDDWFAVDVSGESLDKTGIESWQQGTRINLERSLTLGDELGGHFVFGHVDGLAVLKDVQEDGGSYRLTLEPPVSLMPFLASKGSVSLDGVSLTVNEVGRKTFGVNIIPHTWQQTTLQDRGIDDVLNIEIDMLARYVARQLEKGEPL